MLIKQKLKTYSSKHLAAVKTCKTRVQKQTNLIWKHLQTMKYNSCILGITTRLKIDN